MGIESFLAGGLTSASTSGLSLFFPVLAATLAYFHYEALDNEAPPINVPPDMLLPSYDFVIIGGGSAGKGRHVPSSLAHSLSLSLECISSPNETYTCPRFILSFFPFSSSLSLSFSGAVVASRLSEMEDWNVLLLEAGGDETELSDVPLFAGYLQLTQLDWQYKTESQDDACLGMYLLATLPPPSLVLNII